MDDYGDAYRTLPKWWRGNYANATEEGFASYLAQIEELKLTEEFYDSILPDKFASTTARTAPFLVYVATQCARGVHSLYSDVTIEELYKNKTESENLSCQMWI